MRAAGDGRLLASFLQAYGEGGDGRAGWGGLDGATGGRATPGAPAPAAAVAGSPGRGAGAGAAASGGATGGALAASAWGDGGGGGGGGGGGAPQGGAYVDSGAQALWAGRGPLDDSTLDGWLARRWHSGRAAYDALFLSSLPPPWPGAAPAGAAGRGRGPAGAAGGGGAGLEGHGQGDWSGAYSHGLGEGYGDGLSAVLLVNQTAVHALPAAIGALSSAVLRRAWAGGAATLGGEGGKGGPTRVTCSCAWGRGHGQGRVRVGGGTWERGRFGGWQGMAVAVGS